MSGAEYLIRRTRDRDRWVTIDRATVEDDRLSFKARGLLAYLLSRPDNWRARSEHLASVGPDGRTAVLSAMGELRDAGYLRTVKWQDDGGHWQSVNVVHESPDEPDAEVGEVAPATGVRFPDVGSPDAGSPDAGSPDAITKTGDRDTENEDPSTSDAAASSDDDTTEIEWPGQVRELTRDFARYVQGNGHPLPSRGTKAAQGWYREIDRLLRLGPPGDTGDRPPPTAEEVRTVMAHALTDIRDGPGFPGWGAVIRSPGKFRQQYSRLAIEARRNGRSGGQLAAGYAEAAERLRGRK